MPIVYQILFIFLVSIPGLSIARDLKPFKSDGCTLPPTLMTGDYKSCCYYHDYDYWLGGTLEDKNASDARLISCMMSKGANTWTAGTWQAMIANFAEHAWGADWVPRRDNVPLTAAERVLIRERSIGLKSPTPVIESYSTKNDCKPAIKETIKQVTTLEAGTKIECYLLTKKDYKDPNSQSEVIYTDACLNGFFVFQVAFEKLSPGEQKPGSKIQYKKITTLGGYGLCADKLKVEKRVSEKGPIYYEEAPPLDGASEPLNSNEGKVAY